MHPIKDFLLERGYKLKDCGESWQTAALWRNGDNPIGVAIYKKTGHWFDFPRGVGGSPEELIKLITGESIEFAKETFVSEDKYKVKTRLPLQVLDSLLPTYGLFEERGIRKDLLIKLKAGLCHSPPFSRRVVFPVLDRKGESVIGFAARYFKEKPPENVKKWLLKGKKKDFLYPAWLNENYIREKKEIWILESLGDFLSLSNGGLFFGFPVFGLSLSPVQLNYIIGLGVEKIVICFNNDENGAGGIAAKKLKHKLDKFFEPDNVLVRFPPKNDLGNLNKDEIREFYNSI